MKKRILINAVFAAVSFVIFMAVAGALIGVM